MEGVGGARRVEATPRGGARRADRWAGRRLPGNCGRPRPPSGWTRPADKRRKHLDVYAERAMAPRCVQACSPWHFGRSGWESSRQPLRDANPFAAWTSCRRGGALRGRFTTAPWYIPVSQRKEIGRQRTHEPSTTTVDENLHLDIGGKRLELSYHGSIHEEGIRT